VDVAQALADLTEISSQIEAAVIFAADGSVEGSTLADEGAARNLASAAAKLLAQADGLRSGDEETQVTQIEASTSDGCVFVVRDGDRLIAATTVPNPTVGLVFYDLKSALRDSAGGDEPEKPKRRRPAKKADGSESEATAE
jgi:predicted regulator of Ras-like GTPase activity (Roadblock/LC7/MglB family)